MEEAPGLRQCPRQWVGTCGLWQPPLCQLSVPFGLPGGRGAAEGPGGACLGTEHLDPAFTQPWWWSARFPDRLSVWTAVARAAAPGLRTCPVGVCGPGRGRQGCPQLCVPTGDGKSRTPLSGPWLSRAVPAAPGSPAHVPRGRALCYPGSQARPSETPSPPAVPRPRVLRPGAWLPPWLLPGEEEELELTVVSCALEFNISSSSRAARICRGQAAPVFITTLPGRPSPASRRWEPVPGPQRGRVRTPRPLPARSTDWARRPVGGKDRTCLGVDSWGLLREQGGRRPCGQS